MCKCMYMCIFTPVVEARVNPCVLSSPYDFIYVYIGMYEAVRLYICVYIYVCVYVYWC